MQHQRQKDRKANSSWGSRAEGHGNQGRSGGPCLPSVRNPRMTAHANGVSKMRLSAMFAE